MKKFTKVLLCAALAASMVVPAAMSVSAAELTLQTDNPMYGGTSAVVNDGHGFIEGDLTFTESLNAEDLSDIKVEVNGKVAYWNNGYMGYRHCQLRDDSNHNLPKASLQLGIVGADVVAGENTIKFTVGEDTYTQTFTSNTNILGTSYAKVTGDAKAKTAKAEIVFNTDPGFEIGTTFEGSCHDDHGSKGTFTVTKYDEVTKMYTIESTNFVTTQSLLELKVTSEGEYKDYWVSATINEYNTYVKSEISGTKIAITEATINRDNKPGSNLIDGTSEKVEGGVPTETDPVIITFKTADAVKVNTMILYTGGDDANWNNRAPKAFKLYGVTADGAEELIKDVADSGMQNFNFTPYAIDIDATVAYNSFKMVITSRIDRPQTANQNDWFQLGELEIYSDDAGMTDIYEVKTGAVAYNGTVPTATQPEQPGTTEQPEQPESPKTGDVALVAVSVSIVALAGFAVVSKKRSSAC